MDTENHGDNPPQNNGKNLRAYFSVDYLNLYLGACALLVGDNILDRLSPSLNLSPNILSNLQFIGGITIPFVTTLLIGYHICKSRNLINFAIPVIGIKITIGLLSLVIVAILLLDVAYCKYSEQELQSLKKQVEEENCSLLKSQQKTEEEKQETENQNQKLLDAQIKLVTQNSSLVEAQRQIEEERKTALLEERKAREAQRITQTKLTEATTELNKEQTRARQLEQIASQSQDHIVRRTGNEILRKVRVQATEFEPKPDHKFYTCTENGLFYVYYQSNCGGYQPVFNTQNKVESQYIEDTIDKLNRAGVIIKANAPPKERLDDKTASLQEITWYQLTPRGVYNADEAIKAMQELWPCDPMSENKEGELAAIEQQLLINICEGGVDVDGEYRFSVNGAEGRLKVYVYNHFQKRYLPYVQRGGTPVDLKLVVARLLVRGDIRKSELTNGDETTAWYVLTSQGLEKVRKLFPLSDTCENCKVEEKQEKTAPRKSTNLPAIPPETVPTPHAEPSV